MLCSCACVVVWQGFIFSVPCFLFLSFPSDRDSSTKSSVNKIGKTASRSGSLALNDPTLTNLVRNYPYNTCKEFGLTISIRKTEVMGQDVPSPPPSLLTTKCLRLLTTSLTLARSSPATRR